MRHKVPVAIGLVASVAAVALLVNRANQGDSCIDAVVHWARLAERVGPGEMEEVRSEANREVVDEETRIAVQLGINFMSNVATLGPTAINDLQLESEARRYCDRNGS